MKNHAISVPDWFCNNAIYQINPRTFSKEGTINAIVPELPFLRELGFDIMYLCPIFEEDDSADVEHWSNRQKRYGTNNPKNPYRMNNYFTIDEEYGSLEDLKRFVSEAHSLGMKVLLDLVYMHIGPNAPILKEHPEFAVQDENGDPIYNNYRFVKLDFNSNGLREYLWANMTYLLCEVGVDGFRCDVGDAVPNDFWAEGRRRIQTIKPDAILINEGYKMHRLANTFDACYGFDWEYDTYMVFEGKKSVADLREGYEKIAKSTPTGGLIVRALDNHDTVTDWPQRSEVLMGHDGMELVQVMNYVIDGVPMIYAGNELADTAKVNMFANRFYMGEYEVTDRSKKDTLESIRRQEIYKQLNGLRKNCDVITKGTMSWIENSKPESVISFVREYEGKKIVFIGNLSEVDVNVTLDVELNGGVSILENKCVVSGKDVELAAHGYIVIKL